MSLLKPVESKCLPLHFNYAENVPDQVLDEERRKDAISHFVLRLAFCKKCALCCWRGIVELTLFSEDLRRWFLSQECTLFKLRFEAESRRDKMEFMKLAGLNYEPVCITLMVA